MPSDAERARIEIEVAVRDSFSNTLKSIGRELDSVNKKAMDIGQGGAAGFNRLHREQDQLADSTKRSSVLLGTMSGIIQGLTESVSGPVGLAAGFYAAATSIQNFAAGRVQLQMFSTDVGLSVQRVSSLRQAMADMGMSTEAADQQIAKLGNSIKGMQQYREGSDLIKILNAMGEEEFGAKLLATGRNTSEAIDMILRKFREFNPEAQGHFADQLKMSEFVLDHLKEYEQKVGAAFIGAFEHSESYLRNMNRFQLGIGNIWEQLKESMVTFADDSVWAKINSQLKQEIDDVRAIYQTLESVVTKQPFGQKFDFLNKTPGDVLREMNPYHLPTPNESVKDRFGNWPGKRSDLGTHPDISDFTGRRRDESIEIESDSNKLLRDIRDMMQRTELGIGSGGGGGGGSGATGPGSAIRPFGGQPGSGYTADRLGGARVSGGNVDMKGGERSSTGLYYPGTSTSLGGVVGSNSASRGAGGHQGDDFMMKHGSPLYATKDGTVESYGVDNFGQKTMRVRHEDGSSTSYLHMSERSAPMGSKVSGGQVIGASGTANGVPHLHIEMRNPKGQLIEPSVALGVRQERGGETVRGSYFTDQRTASGLDASKTPGIALPSREGLGKMYEVTGPDGRKMMLPQIDVGPAKWTGRGIDLSGPAADAMGYGRKNFPTDQNFSYQQQNARDQVDKTQSVGAAPTKVDASLDVDFKNIPSWVRTSVEGGAFKDLKVTRSTPQGGKAEASNSAGNNEWAY